jgi:hypothetical protein
VEDKRAGHVRECLLNRFSSSRPFKRNTQGVVAIDQPSPRSLEARNVDAHAKRADDLLDVCTTMTGVGCLNHHAELHW